MQLFEDFQDLESKILTRDISEGASKGHPTHLWASPFAFMEAGKSDSWPSLASMDTNQKKSRIPPISAIYRGITEPILIKNRRTSHHRT